MLCPECLGRAGENPFLRFRLRQALAERSREAQRVANAPEPTGGTQRDAGVSPADDPDGAPGHAGGSPPAGEADPA